MKRKFPPYILALFLFGQSLKIYGQIKISGPECIVPGTEYQYDFFGKFDKRTEINICVEGGVVATNSNSCYKTSDVNYVRIIWSENITKGKVSITSASGNGSFSVRPTRILQGGKIDSLSKLQVVRPSSIPKPINCTVARGGNCSPSFSYQWERSDDNLRWTELKGAGSQNLSFSARLSGTIFFRRKIFETVSNSITYSDVAIVVVSTLSGTN